MKFLARHAALLMKIGIALCLLWTGFMLVLLWLSGEQETARALVSGKRFIIYLADGRVEGATPAQKAEAKPAVAVPPPPPPASEAAAQDDELLAAVQPSSNPITQVSDDLVDKSTGTPLPKISASDVKPWHYYSKNFRRLNEFPLIAIVVTGLGHSKKEMELAVRLDDRIGLSFSPYATAIASWSAAARLTGHEMYVDLPLQTVGYPNEDPGPYAILLTHSNAENIKNLYWAMSRFQGYTGLVAPPGEVVTHNADTFAPLRSEIAPRGVMLLTGRDATFQVPTKKEKNPLPLVNADVWIDEELSELSIQARLATLEQIAQRNGMAIGITRSYPLSLGQIKHWQDTVGSRGIVLAPASFIAKLKYP